MAFAFYLFKDDDCEEGEIREPGSRHTFVRPMCRFYTRGNCTWGANCRFLHPGINDKGTIFYLCNDYSRVLDIFSNVQLFLM